MTQVSRRTLNGLATAGIALPLLTACGSDDKSSGSGSPADGESSGATADGPLASTSDIEVGGGTIFSDQKVVVTQPTEGEFKAFDTTCTHTGCPVKKVEDGVIKCPCHGSSYSIEDGSVQGGPAPSPLSEVEITVDGDSIVLV